MDSNYEILMGYEDTSSSSSFKVVDFQYLNQLAQNIPPTIVKPVPLTNYQKE